MEISDFSLFIFGVTTVLSTSNLSCALPTSDVKTLKDSTPSPDIPQWIVKDDNNKTCMMMAMNATTLGSDIPPTATATQKTGSCDSNSAVFSLKWGSGFNFYKMSISFEVAEKSYKLVKVNGSLSQGFSFISWSSNSSSFQSASIGNSMTCENLNIGDIHFAKYQFQPFAQQSGEEYGKAEACTFGVLRWWGYLILGVICFVFVAAIVAVVLIIFKRRGKRGYSQLQ